MMNIIIIFLCTLANQVISQTKDISPARILAQQTTLSENSDLYLTCSTFGKRKDSMVFVYLLKNGFGIEKLIQKQDRNDITFFIPRVGLHHSGNYSCVYSAHNYRVSEVANKGTNTIQILVISNFLPADISVVGPSAVHVGDRVEFRCTVSHHLQTLGECELIYSYLRKNETILLVQPFKVTQMQTTFTIEGAVLRDSGYYSCIVLPSKCIYEHEYTLHGTNNVFLEVKVDLVPAVLIHGGVITLMLLLGVCLCWIRNKKIHSALSGPRAMAQQTNIYTLGEQQEQIERDELEAHDAFGMDDDEDCQNNLAAEGSRHAVIYEDMAPARMPFLLSLPSAPTGHRR